MTDQQERSEILALYDGLRVTDVNDGLDAAGLADLCVLDRAIRPLWKDLEGFAHRIYGFAHTVRFVPTRRPRPEFADREEFYRWMGQWYGELAGGPITAEIQPGDVVVIDGRGVGECGFIGSNNSLSWIEAGARGVVTNGGARDTDELCVQRVPVYSRGVSRGIRPGRLELESTGRPVTVGGVCVRPGDLVVADGDGVVVVPPEKVRQVATVALETQERDKKTRRGMYDKLGRSHDQTVTARDQLELPGEENG